MKRIVFTLALFLLGFKGYAQVSTGDILGSVTDASGAAIPGAAVTIKDLGTQSVRTAKSGESGEFVFTALQPGHYSVTVSAPGFKGFVTPDLSLSAGDRTRVGPVLQVGESSETVEVLASTLPSLQTDTSTLSTIATEAQVEDLPLNGRNYIALAQLAAGAHEGSAISLSGGSRPDDRRQTSSISVNGQSDANNNELIDGVDNNERVIGSIGVRPSVDAIAEFRVQTNTYPAEIGRTAGAVVNVISKAGTDQFHGSAYEFLRNDALDARDYFASTGRRPKYRQNQFGGSIGGPILKRKTFFFGDYEGLRIVQGQTTVSTVPTLFEEQHPGNFSDIGGPVLAAATLSPIALKYFALFPAPTSSALSNNFTYSPNRTQFSNTFDVRVDHKLSEKDSLFARYSFNNVNTFTPPGLPEINGALSVGNANLFSGANQTRAQSYILNYTHVFSPNLLMELKAGYTRINIASLNLNTGQNLSTQFGIQGANFSPQTTGLSTVEPVGYATLGDGPGIPLNYLDNTFQYSGALTYSLGAHTIKAGAQLIRRQVTSAQQLVGTGIFVFVGFSGPGSTLASLLQGNVLQVIRIAEFDRPSFRTFEPTGYVQDDWRAAKNLTLNFGVRYDVYTQPTEAHNRLSNLDTRTGALLIADTPGVSSTGNVPTDHRDVSPRVGFEATLRPRTVLRGGYGITYFPDDTAFPIFLDNTPFSVDYQPSPFSTTLSTPLPSTVAPGVSGAFQTISTTHAKTAYIHQFNLNLQQEFGGNVVTVAYVGGLGHHLTQLLDVNFAPPDTNPNDPLQSRRPLYAVAPNVTSVEQQVSVGFSSYNSLQMQVERRLSHGLTVNANYTLARALSNTVDIADAGGGTGSLEGVGAVPSRTSTLDYGNSDLDIRDRVAAEIAYALPYGDGLHGLRAVAAKGWQVNAINVWSTGSPFTIVNSSAQANTGASTYGDRPNQVGSPSIANKGIASFFNTVAYQLQPFGTIGNVPKNSLYGPHIRHLDVSLFKSFDLEKGTQLQFRAESFNLTNTPTFANPDGVLGDPSFGAISSTRNGSTPRELQFALKLLF